MARTSGATVWTGAANPWWEAMADPPPEEAGPWGPRPAEPGRGGTAGATGRPAGWRRLLAWLIEYHRY